MKTKIQNPHLRFALWVAVATVLIAGIVAGVYLVAYRAYPTVAEWTEPAGHEAFSLDGESWRRVGTVGENGLNAKNYTPADSIGRVGDDGAATRADADGTPDLSRDHAYVLYHVKNKTDCVLLLEPDGSHVLYMRDVAEWKNAGNRETFVYKGNTYVRAGSLSDYDYSVGAELGFVTSPDATNPDSEMVYSVKLRADLLVVNGVDGEKQIYCREGATLSTLFEDET